MSASSTSSTGGRLSAEMRASSRTSPLSPNTRMAMGMLGTSPTTTKQLIKDDPTIKDMCMVMAKLLNAQADVQNDQALHAAYQHVIDNQARLLNERYAALKHTRSPHHTTEVTRVSRLSNGTVVSDHEVFQDDREIEHDRTYMPSSQRLSYVPPAERLSRASPRTTEVTRLSRNSDGTVELDHEVFSNGQKVKHDSERVSVLTRSPPRFSRSGLVSPPRSRVISPRAVASSTQMQTQTMPQFGSQ